MTSGFGCRTPRLGRNFNAISDLGCPAVTNAWMMAASSPSAYSLLPASDDRIVISTTSSAAAPSYGGCHATARNLYVPAPASSYIAVDPLRRTLTQMAPSRSSVFDALI